MPAEARQQQERGGLQGHEVDALLTPRILHEGGQFERAPQTTEVPATGSVMMMMMTMMLLRMMRKRMTLNPEP